jgi:hypothetical protein
MMRLKYDGAWVLKYFFVCLILLHVWLKFIELLNYLAKFPCL